MNKNPFRQVEFLTSAAKLQQSPPDEGLEMAFAGRSNAGKSSAINGICERQNLARTSRTPGRTQLLNYFTVTDQSRFVDLPGYGYAKVPVAIQRQWQRALVDYFQDRQALCGVVVVMDCRRPLTDFDVAMLDLCEDAGLAAHCLLTKADKLSRSDAKSALMKVQRQIQEYEVPVTAQLFSATRKDGVVEARRLCAEWLQL